MPGSKKAPRENAKEVAERILHDVLNMADCKIKFDFDHVDCIEQGEESPSYPGVQTVYRKEILTGHVTVENAETLRRIGATEVAEGGRGEFIVEDKLKKRRTFAWVSDVGPASKKGDFSALVYPPIGLETEELEDFLNRSQIDVSKWGTDTFKSLAEFSEELVKGEATLTKQVDGRLVRVVDIVVLKVGKQKGGDVLVEVEETHKENKTPRKRLPAVKRRSDEHQVLAARRLIKTHLQISDNYIVIDPVVRIEEVVEGSTSYYGLPTLYRKRFMSATLSLQF